MKKLFASGSLKTDLVHNLFLISILCTHITMSALLSYSLLYDRAMMKLFSCVLYIIGNVYGWKALKIQIYKNLLSISKTEDLTDSMIIPVVISCTGALLGVLLAHNFNDDLGTLATLFLFVFSGIVGLFVTEIPTDI